jgi:hypothetical protein
MAVWATPVRSFAFMYSVYQAGRPAVKHWPVGRTDRGADRLRSRPTAEPTDRGAALAQ